MLQCSSGVSHTSSPHRPSARTSRPDRGSGTSWSRTATRRGVSRPVHHQATPWFGRSDRRTYPPTGPSSAAKSISQASAHSGSEPGGRRCSSSGRAIPPDLPDCPGGAGSGHRYPRSMAAVPLSRRQMLGLLGAGLLTACSSTRQGSDGAVSSSSTTAAPTTTTTPPPPLPSDGSPPFDRVNPMAGFVAFGDSGGGEDQDAVAAGMLRWMRDGHRVDALVTTGDN